MSEENYQLSLDSYGRMCAKITPKLEVGIKVLSMTNKARIERNEHAFVVLNIETELGMLIVRDIRIVYIPAKEKFHVRWRQWRTGKVRDGRPEYLDVAGPLSRETRVRFSEVILSIFEQMKREDQAGTLGRQVPGETLGTTNPQLLELKAIIDGNTPSTDGPAANPDSIAAVE